MSFAIRSNKNSSSQLSLEQLHSFFLSLQKSLQILAFGVARAGLWIGIITVVSSVASATRSLIFLRIAPMLVLFFMVLQQHQWWKQSVTSAASVEWKKRNNLNTNSQHQSSQNILSPILISMANEGIHASAITSPRRLRRFISSFISFRKIGKRNKLSRVVA